MMGIVADGILCNQRPERTKRNRKEKRKDEKASTTEGNWGA
jgi:hypothetical protein